MHSGRPRSTPNVRNHLAAYVTSLHFLPILLATAVGPPIYLSGHALLSAAVVTGGLALSALTLWLEPIVTLAPLGGPCRVSFKELPPTRRTEQGDRCPPLTLVYPTTERRPKAMHWLPFGDHEYLKGMAAYAHVPFIAVRDMQLTTIAAHMDAPPQSLIRPDGSARPIFIHSHGLAGFARLYSSFLTTVAARGAVVVAVNHTDQSAAFCRDAANTLRIPLKGGLRWTYRDREPQLRVRIDEVRNTIAEVLNGSVLRQLGFPEADVEAYVRGNPQVVLVGHSFGGATMLATAHEEEKRLRAGKPNYHSAIACVVAHDPWHIPLWGRFVKATPSDGAELDETLKGFTEEEATYSVPTLLHHSQAWQMDKESWGFFTQLTAAIHARMKTTTTTNELLLPAQRQRIEEANRRMSKALAAEGAGQGQGTTVHPEDWLVTRVTPKTGHLSVTDMPFLSPVVFKERYQTRHPEEPIQQWADEAMRFAEIHLCKNPEH